MSSYGVAHEINNPLQTVIGSLELALDQHLEPSLRADVERARFEAGRAGRIVRNLLRFVRQAPNERLLLDLNEIVTATMSVWDQKSRYSQRPASPITFSAGSAANPSKAIWKQNCAQSRPVRNCR